MATLCLEVTQECNNVNMVQDSQTLPKIKKRCINIYITFTKLATLLEGAGYLLLKKLIKTFQKTNMVLLRL